MNDRVNLNCLATGFYPTDVDLQMTRDGQLLTQLNGLRSSKVRPNHDNTYQRRDTVEILTSDTSEFTCELLHPSFTAPIRKVWGKNLNVVFTLNMFDTKVKLK